MKLIALLLAAVFAPAVRLLGGSRETPAWRLQAEKDLRAMLGEETPAELRELDRAERYTHDRNASSGAFWAGSDTWIDSRGRVRKL